MKAALQGIFIFSILNYSYIVKISVAVTQTDRCFGICLHEGIPSDLKIQIVTTAARFLFVTKLPTSYSLFLYSSTVS